MLEQIVHIDQTLFFAINQQIANPVFDTVLPFMRHKSNWYALYLLLAVFLVWKYRLRGLGMLAALIVCVAIADQTSSHFIKPLVERLRPCNDPLLKEQVRLLVRCGSGYSFTSSHATNHFALAISFILIRPWGLWVWIVAIAWASIIAFAQVYVGVHYPIDIVAGALLGSGIGITIAWVHERITGAKKLLTI